MELSDMLNETSPCPVKYKSYAFICQIFTERLTPAYKAKLLALSVANEEHEEASESDVPDDIKDDNARMLADLIASWTDKDGKEIVLHGVPHPPTYENWLNFSYSMMAAFIKQITSFLGDIANPQNEPS